jgi:hypothetical protein
MAAKLKVDQLETVDGTGNITVNNQLTGLTSASMPTGSMLQVVEGTLGTPTSINSTSWTDVFNATITGVSASSTIVGFVSLQGYLTVDNSNYTIRMREGSRDIGGGTASGSMESAMFTNLRFTEEGHTNFFIGNNFTDTGHSGGSLTYQLQSKGQSAIYFARSQSDSDVDDSRPKLSIILMEIAG